MMVDGSVRADSSVGVGSNGSVVVAVEDVAPQAPSAAAPFLANVVGRPPTPLAVSSGAAEVGKQQNRLVACWDAFANFYQDKETRGMAVCLTILIAVAVVIVGGIIICAIRGDCINQGESTHENGHYF